MLGLLDWLVIFACALLVLVVGYVYPLLIWFVLVGVSLTRLFEVGCLLSVYRFALWIVCGKFVCLGGLRFMWLVYMFVY